MRLLKRGIEISNCMYTTIKLRKLDIRGLALNRFGAKPYKLSTESVNSRYKVNCYLGIWVGIDIIASVNVEMIFN